MTEHQGFTLTSEGDPSISRRLLLRGAVSGAVIAAFTAAGWQVTAQEATPPTALELPEGPVMLVVLYGTPADPDAFATYYRESHLPLAAQIPYFQRLEAGQGWAGFAGEPPAFFWITTMVFGSMADLEAAAASPEAQIAFADAANFATGGLTVTIVTDLETITSAEVGPAATPAG